MPSLYTMRAGKYLLFYKNKKLVINLSILFVLFKKKKYTEGKNVNSLY